MKAFMAPLMAAALLLPTVAAFKHDIEPLRAPRPFAVAPANMNAFPGAEGYGAVALWNDTGDTTTANRACNYANTEIHVVTDLGTSGPGTFDSIINNELREDTIDVVVWNVAGETEADEILTNESCLVVAPWTAPEPGVDFNADMTIRGDHGVAHDIVFVGFKFSPDGNKPGGRLVIGGGNRIIATQFSARGCSNDCAYVFMDNSTSGSDPPLENVTLSHFIIGPLVTGGRGSGCRADDDAGERDDVRRCDIHTGIIAHFQNRGPLNEVNIQHEDSGVVVRNLAVYNYGFNGAEAKDTAYIDWRDMCIVEGPQSSSNRGLSYDTADGSLLWLKAHIYVDEVAKATAGAANPCSSGPPADQWSVHTNSLTTAELDTVKYGVDRTGPQADPNFAITGLTAADIWPRIVAVAPAQGTELAVTDILVGAGIRIGEDGKRYAMRGNIDSTLVNDARTDGGPNPLYADVSEYGPDDTNLGSGSAWRDNDGDGLPNAFENRICGGSDSTCATPQGDGDGDLYVNAIEYVFGSDPTVATATDGTESSGFPTTYNDSILLYMDSLVLDTIGSCPSCMIYHRWESEDSVPATQLRGRVCTRDDGPGTRGVFISLDSVATGNILSTEAANDLLNDWLRDGCSPLQVRTLSIPSG